MVVALQTGVVIVACLRCIRMNASICHVPPLISSALCLSPPLHIVSYSVPVSPGLPPASGSPILLDLPFLPQDSSTSNKAKIPIKCIQYVWFLPPSNAYRLNPFPPLIYTVRQQRIYQTRLTLYILLYFYII